MTGLIPNPPLTLDDVASHWQNPNLPAAFPLGEDGDKWIVLGHVDPPLAVDALEAAAQDMWSMGLDDAIPHLDREEIEVALERTWGIFTVHQGDCHRVTGVIPIVLEPDEVNECACNYEASWWVTWHEISATTSGAVPIMVLDS